MSSEDRSPNEQTRIGRLNNYRDIKEAVHERDRHQCQECRGSREAVETLDIDHIVPRSAGGSDQFSNLVTLCRRCHDAKHGNGIVPSVQFKSTGGMTDIEFQWFRQFLKQILPALTQSVGVHLEPKFNLDQQQAWYLPLGELRRLDSTLAQEDSSYYPLQASEYM